VERASSQEADYREGWGSWFCATLGDRTGFGRDSFKSNDQCISV